MQTTLIKSLTSHISKSQREATLLFTDIEDSTRYWGNRGDVKGRLMVDRHNRILFPVIRQFHGRIIKTIGDSIMALFNQPEDAMNAAIAIQQALQQAREEDRQFRIRVRIGLHTGEAIVEHNDVFGDVVNVAARIESEAEADEILFSGRLAKRLEKGRFSSKKKGGFTPKGKHARIALYQANWREHEDLLAGLKLNSLTPLGSRQTIEMLGYALALIGVLYFFHLYYLRYLLSDNEKLALLFLNPGAMLTQYWQLSLASCVLITILLWLAIRINAIPYRVLKLLKAGAAGGVLFVALYSLSSVLPLHSVPNFSSGLYSSQHLFVEVLQDNAAIHESPASKAPVLFHADIDTLLLLSDVKRIGDTVWNKVLIGEGSFGWVKRIQPARMGVAEARITQSEKFTLRYGDLFLLLLALPGFIWGYRSFHIRPQ